MSNLGSPSAVCFAPQSPGEGAPVLFNLAFIELRPWSVNTRRIFPRELFMTWLMMKSMELSAVFFTIDLRWP